MVSNLTVLSSTTDKINLISNHFWDSWRQEYVVNLHETQRISKLNIKKRERYPDTFGELALTGVLPSRDSEIRRAMVSIAKTNIILKDLVNKLFLIENTYREPTKWVWEGNKS